MTLVYGFIIAFSMYSRLPMPRVEWTKERMRYALCFFPLVGGVIGLLFILWMRFGAYLTGEGNLHTAVLLLIPVLVTGGIHLDGFLDTADALSSQQTAERKLEILKDPHTGAFAVICGVCYFVLEFGVYSQLDLRTAGVAGISFVLSRAFSGLSVVTFRMAKDSGLAASFSDAAQKRAVAAVMAAYILICPVLLYAAGGACGLCSFGAGLLAFLYYRWMSYRKFGGITGDLAGFFLQVCELAMAAAAVISARFF